jgi:hypothetical protein
MGFVGCSRFEYPFPVSSFQVGNGSVNSVTEIPGNIQIAEPNKPLCFQGHRLGWLQKSRKIQKGGNIKYQLPLALAFMTRFSWSIVSHPVKDSSDEQ